MSVTRIKFLNVPIDLLRDEDIEETVITLLKKEGVQQVVFITLVDLLKARHNNDFRSMIENASLCLPISKTLIRGIQFLNKKNLSNNKINKIDIDKFSIITKFLNIIDTRYKSLYIFGGRQESLFIAEKNVRSTYKGIHLVGRFAGYYNKNLETKIISAISKAQPSMVLVSSGVPYERKWIYKNRDKFKSGIFIYDPSIVDIFSGFQKQDNDKKFFEKIYDVIIQFVKNPLCIFNIFKFFWYKILLIFYRLFRNE